jgi:hypothetical protein
VANAFPAIRRTRIALVVQFIKDMTMKTIEEIVAAAKHLKPADFVQLRKRLDRVERKLWETESSATTTELRDADIDDRQLDQIIRRRRESRS